MRKSFAFILTLFMGLLIFTGCVDLTNQVSTKKARIVYSVPKNITSEKVEDALRKAIALRTSDIKEVENFMPEELPDKPAHPINKNIFGGIATIAAGNPQLEAMQLDTSNAWYTVQGTETLGMAFNKRFIVYKGAIYPYKKGYKVYIYEFYSEGTDGLIGHLTKSMAQAMTGGIEASLLLISQISNKFKEKIPSAKLINVYPLELKKVKLNWWNKGNFGLDKN